MPSSRERRGGSAIKTSSHRSTVTVYLAGPIRDGYTDDYEWRHKMLNRLERHAGVRVFNPIGGFLYDRHAKSWSAPAGEVLSGNGIVNVDFWYVDRADIIVANLLDIEDYPCIGTLLELGRSTQRSVLRYLILPKEYRGHVNSGFSLHPFLANLAAHVYPSVESACDGLSGQLAVLSGEAIYNTTRIV